MLIALYMALTTIIIPQMGSFVAEAINVVMPCVIVLVGMMMLLGAVGMKVSTNLGATVTRGAFGAIGFLGRKMIEGLGWIVKSIAKLLSNLYQESKKALISWGLSTAGSTLLSVVIVVIVLALII